MKYFETHRHIGHIDIHIENNNKTYVKPYVSYVPMCFKKQKNL